MRTQVTWILDFFVNTCSYMYVFYIVQVYYTYIHMYTAGLNLGLWIGAYLMFIAPKYYSPVFFS